MTRLSRRASVFEPPLLDVPEQRESVERQRSAFLGSIKEVMMSSRDITFTSYPKFFWIV
jgi:hypothetical protein